MSEDKDLPRIDFVDVRSQEAVKRALTVALAGNHSVVLIGPSGHGKTMLAKAANGIRAIQVDEITIDSKDPERTQLFRQYVRMTSTSRCLPSLTEILFQNAPARTRQISASRWTRR